jgi:hypothetical protein
VGVVYLEVELNEWCSDHQKVDAISETVVQNVTIDRIQAMGDKWGMEIHHW